MKAKTIVIVVLLILVFIVLLNNNEQASFWLFGQIYTSKLIILSIFFVLGMITGGIVFRRRDKHPKEYTIHNPPNYTTPLSNSENEDDEHSNLSDEDREFLRRD